MSEESGAYSQESEFRPALLKHHSTPRDDKEKIWVSFDFVSCFESANDRRKAG